MTSTRFDYSPINTRPRLTWPDAARVALWVVPNVEHYEFVPGQVRVRDPWPRTPHPDVLNYGIREYGNRVGFWRLLEVLDRHQLRCTVSLNYSVLELFPQMHQAMSERGWEYMSHGLYNTRYHWGLDEDAERAAIAECIALHRKHTGGMLAGWFSPAASWTLRTPDLVAEAGIKYYCDFYHDDQPTPLRVRSGRLISIPYTMEINDSIAWRRPDEGEAFARAIRDEFDTLWREGATQGRVMCIALHPFITGQPHRIKHLDRALAYILSHDHVWCATGEQIADWYLAQQASQNSVATVPRT